MCGRIHPRPPQSRPYRVLGHEGLELKRTDPCLVGIPRENGENSYRRLRRLATVILGNHSCTGFHKTTHNTKFLTILGAPSRCKGSLTPYRSTILGSSLERSIASASPLSERISKALHCRNQDLPWHLCYPLHDETGQRQHGVWLDHLIGLDSCPEDSCFEV